MVPPHLRDKVSPEKLQPLERVELGRFVTCWKIQKKQVKSKMLRDLRPKRRKMEEPLLGKINTLTEKTTFFFSVVKTTCTRFTGLKIKT